MAGIGLKYRVEKEKRNKEEPNKKENEEKYCPKLKTFWYRVTFIHSCKFKYT